MDGIIVLEDELVPVNDIPRFMGSPYTMLSGGIMIDFLGNDRLISFIPGFIL